ncbi:MAG: hypothetical protein OEV06_12510, partial [Anaerolineae bacterium]|nr:hypothetical protein [Anaerolineae bacterium]
CAAQGDRGRAFDQLDQFRLDTPTDSPQYVYVLLAETFLDAAASGGLEQACQAVRQIAAPYESQIVSPLGSLVYGYANPDYTLEDICP